jgi:hypothetical protein
MAGSRWLCRVSGVLLWDARARESQASLGIGISRKDRGSRERECRRISINVRQAMRDVCANTEQLVRRILEA